MQTLEHRKEMEAYALAIGWSPDYVAAATDERLERMMGYMADECAKYGCD